MTLEEFRDQLSEAHETIRQLRAQITGLAAADQTPRYRGVILSRTERLILYHLRNARKPLPAERMIAIMSTRPWGQTETEDPTAAAGAICRLRKELTGLPGVSLKPLRGEGFSLPIESKAILA